MDISADRITSAGAVNAALGSVLVRSGVVEQMHDIYAGSNIILHGGDRIYLTGTVIAGQTAHIFCGCYIQPRLTDDYG